MDAEQYWTIIAAERRATADLLATLTEEQWRTPSLAEGWLVRDVAAHLALASQSPSVPALLRDLLLAWGSFDRMNHDTAVRYAETRRNSQLADELHDNAESRRLPAPTNYKNTLVDVLVHEQDIARPLGIDRPMPLDAARAGADHVWSMGFPYRAQRKLRGYRLVATDVDWAAGAGEEVREPISLLLLHLTGRNL